MHEHHSPDIDKWLKLIAANSIGPATFSKLITHFGSIDYALRAPAAELKYVDGIGPKTAERIVETRNDFDSDAELKLAEKLGVWIINITDNRYPAPLRAIHDPPPVLYVKGTLSKADNLAIAIVGSRRCSLYGKEQASRFSHLLASAGFTIVSGGARGIDTAAHQGTLSAEGRTVVVQGCGLANTYPPENKKLFEIISETGALVSELPLNYEPLAENFPPRNRIIAGISLATLVIEAGMHSGALITAGAAIDNNREVMAIPGKIDSPLSKGAHQLIKEGAALVESIDDVLDNLGSIGNHLQEHVTTATKQAEQNVEKPLFDGSQLNLTKDETLIYDCIGSEPIYLDQIIAEVDVAPGAINASLVSLRLKGLIKQLPGSMFTRSR